MTLIYHITSKQQWTEAQAKGFYEAPSLHTEGFIHCSKKYQVDGVLKRYYTGKTDLVKLIIDADKLTSRLQYDMASSVNEIFPHVHGPINLDAVTGTELL